MQTLISIVTDVARIPSFSSYEERAHPYICNTLNDIAGVSYDIVNQRNIAAWVPGNRETKPVALSAHIDKINHFGAHPPAELPVTEGPDYLEGVLDNAVGVGILLRLAQVAVAYNWPPLLLLFSEMEESTGLKHHPELLRNKGEGLEHSVGARELARYLIKKKLKPHGVITVDTTPLFQGEQGAALYSGHWEFTGQHPEAAEVQATEQIKQHFLNIDPGLLSANNTNDYLTFGKELNFDKTESVPSVALEPAIYPYHQKDERVYFADIERVFEILKTYMTDYA